MFRIIRSAFAHRIAATLIAAALVTPLAASSCGSSDAGPSSTTCDLAGVQALFNSKGCTLGGCHGSAQDAAGLDLKSAGLADRLLGKGPTAGVGSQQSMCAGMNKTYLVAGSNPASGLLIDKITLANPGCGVRMPVGMALTSGEQECVKSWALTLTSP